MEELFAPDAEKREVASRTAPDGSVLIQTTSVRVSGEVVTVWRKESNDVGLHFDYT